VKRHFRIDVFFAVFRKFELEHELCKNSKKNVKMFLLRMKKRPNVRATTEKQANSGASSQ